MSVVYLESAPGIQTVFFLLLSSCLSLPPLPDISLLLLPVILYSVMDQEHTHSLINVDDCMYTWVRVGIVVENLPERL